MASPVKAAAKKVVCSNVSLHLLALLGIQGAPNDGDFRVSSAASVSDSLTTNTNVAIAGEIEREREGNADAVGTPEKQWAHALGDIHGPSVSHKALGSVPRFFPDAQSRRSRKWRCADR